ncbi:diphthamide biosynthesis protein 3 [Cryptococcus neoformans]|nr:diphthamide biosynthesis protein 3 [Cryptococcus neoformans var. grubii]
MPNYYDELEIEDFAWDPIARVFHYPCPCGDRFEISKGQLRDGEEIAICPSCSLIVRVIYDYLDWEDYVTTDDEDDGRSVDTPLSNTTPDSTDPVVLGSAEVEAQPKTASSAVLPQQEDCSLLTDRLAELQVESGQGDEVVQDNKKEDGSGSRP